MPTRFWIRDRYILERKFQEIAFRLHPDCPENVDLNLPDFDCLRQELVTLYDSRNKAYGSDVPENTWRHLPKGHHAMAYLPRMTRNPSDPWLDEYLGPLNTPLVASEGTAPSTLDPANTRQSDQQLTIPQEINEVNSTLINFNISDFLSMTARQVFQSPLYEQSSLHTRPTKYWFARAIFLKHNMEEALEAQQMAMREWQALANPRIKRPVVNTSVLDKEWALLMQRQNDLNISGDEIAPERNEDYAGPRPWVLEWHSLQDQTVDANNSVHSVQNTPQHSIDGNLDCQIVQSRLGDGAAKVVDLVTPSPVSKSTQSLEERQSPPDVEQRIPPTAPMQYPNPGPEFQFRDQAKIVGASCSRAQLVASRSALLHTPVSGEGGYTYRNSHTPIVHTAYNLPASSHFANRPRHQGVSVANQSTHESDIIASTPIVSSTTVGYPANSKHDSAERIPLSEAQMKRAYDRLVTLREMQSDVIASYHDHDFPQWRLEAGARMLNDFRMFYGIPVPTTFQSTDSTVGRSRGKRSSYEGHANNRSE